MIKREVFAILLGIENRNKIEVQNFQTAIKEYMSLKDKKISRLIEYAEKFGIRHEVMKYLQRG